MWKQCWHLWLMLVTVLVGSSVQARDLPEFTELVKQAGPAVVNISSTQTISARSLGLPPPSVVPSPDPDSEKLFDEWFKKFLEQNQERGSGNNLLDFDTSASGSGFILSPEGYIVTNHHVVAGAKEVKVRLTDKREFIAKVIGSDERTDIALLKVAATNLPTLKMGNSQKLQVGEWVLAIGSPFGFDHSATAGIVSAKGRRLPTDNYVSFIQTDVAINPGNSGGPLFNLAGEVVGINSQIYSRSGGFMGVSFAIPIDTAIEVVEQLKTAGKVARGWLGVYIQELDSDLAQSFNMAKPEGALVVQVMPSGPAGSLLKPGDVITSFASKPIVNAADLPPLVASSVIGSEQKVEIVRKGKVQTFSIEVAELPTDREANTLEENPKQRPAPSDGILGMQVSAINPVTREALDIAEGGVRVEAVLGDPARRAGIMAGDILTQLDGRLVSTPEQLQKLASHLEVGKTVAVLVQREEGARFLALKIEANAR